MKNVILFLLVIFSLGCKLATRLSIEKIDNSSIVRYDLFYNNRTAKHKPFDIIVSVSPTNTGSTHTILYSFYLDSNKVEKFENHGRKTERKYVLVLHSTISDKTNANAVFNNELNPDNENLFSVSELEFKIFEKVIYFSDSLHLKAFDFLKQAKRFQLVPKN